MNALKLVCLCLWILWLPALGVVAGGAAASGDKLLATGGISGKVSVTAGYPSPKPLAVFKNRAFCGATVPNETLVVGADGGLQNAAVILRPQGRQAPLRPGLLVLDNDRCAFAPHVQIGVVGSELLLKNSDPVLHAVHARLGKETLFNIGLPSWRQVIKRLDRPGVIRIDCDVLHTWMSAAIVVSDTPYFAVTDSAGRFTIDGVPTGEYKMEVWHERLGMMSSQFKLSRGRSRVVEVVYSPK